MSVEEALNKIEEIKNKIIHTKSKKIKALYMVDLIAIQDFLAVSYGIDIPDDDIYLSSVFYDSLDRLELDGAKMFDEFKDINKLTKKLANGSINIFDKAGFEGYYYDHRETFDYKFLNDVLMQMLEKLDSKIIDRYNKTLDTGILTSDIFGYDGVCWNLYSDNTQMINISTSYYEYNDKKLPINFYQTFAHEFGHAVHMDTINSSMKNKNVLGTFSESLPIMFEKMFLKTLEDNNVDISNSLRESYYRFLDNALIARAGAIALENDDLEYGYIIPDKYFSNKYFDKYQYLTDDFYNTDYFMYLPYFYGEIVAQHMLDRNNYNFKDATKELLELLMKAEYTDSKTLVEEIQLNKVPKGMARAIRKIK